MSSITNQTLESLLVSQGAVGAMSDVGSYSFEDLIFERYYNADYKSSQLNIDFSDYSNFVFYGTAEGRLRAFREKLLRIERIQRQLEPIFASQSIANNLYTTSSIKFGPVASVQTGVYVINPSQSYAYTGSTSTPYYIQEKTKEISLEIESIVRSFDPYEEYLFFDQSNEPYTASFAHADGGQEYNASAAWPKNVATQVYSPLVVSGSDWFDSQLEIAKRYDQFNPNNLIFTVPLHILEDDASVDFITFVSMVGNFFDNLKPFIDQFTEIYDRSPDPNEGLSKELINEIAESFGIELPNLMAIRNIQEYVLGTTDTVAVKEATAETWKRLLHNLAFIQKSKGTKTSIETLFRSLGFHPALISIKESGPTHVSSYQLVDEFTNSLRFMPQSGSRITLPQNIVGTTPKTLQIRFSTEIDFSTIPTSSIFTGDNTWKCELVAHPLTPYLQRVEVKTSGLTPIITSSYATFNDGEFYDMMIRKLPSSVDLTVIKNDAGEIIYSSSMQESSNVILSRWNTTTNIVVGGGGSLNFRTFEGLIDEIRLWGDEIGDAEFISQTNDPGSFVGNSYSSSIDNLYAQFSFINEENLSTNILTNDSPYELKATLFPTASVVGFYSSSQYVRAERVVRYNIPTLGASSYISNQIKVPAYQVSDSWDSSGIPTLYTNKSHTLKYASGLGQAPRTITIAISPTDFINQRISRAFGALNLTDAIGDPSGLVGEGYPELEELKRYYANNFTAATDTNKLISIFETLISNLRDYIQQLIPAHSNLICGILIEPNILERKKINFHRGLSLSGTATKKTVKSMVSESYAQQQDVIYSLEDTIDIHDGMVISGGWHTYDADIDAEVTSVIDETSVSAPFYDVWVDDGETATTSGDYFAYENTIYVDQAEVLADYFSYEGSVANILADFVAAPDSLYPGDAVNILAVPMLDTILNLHQISSSIQDGLIFKLPEDLSNNDARYFREIGPASDFSDYGVVTYFNNPDGIYLFERAEAVALPTNTLNFSTQSWVSGNFYERNDVVVQRGVEGIGKNGNDRYYRFISSTNTPVESFKIPYFDQELWEPVRFTKFRRTVPRRVVFDLQGQSPLATVFSALNAISPDKILATNNRSFVPFSNISLAGSGTTTGVFNIQNIFALLGYASGALNIRLRLFRTEIDRNALANTLIDLTISTTSLVTLANLLVLYNNDNPATSTVYYRFDNLDALDKNFEITFYYFGIDAKPLVPLGYLPRHYKFFRDNGTATKRRNYLGCLQTQDTTLDGESPIQIIVSPSSDLIISPTSQQTDITIGGGGTLNVS